MSAYGVSRYQSMGQKPLKTKTIQSQSKVLQLLYACTGSLPPHGAIPNRCGLNTEIIVCSVV